MDTGNNTIDFDGFKITVDSNTVFKWLENPLLNWNWKNKPIDEDWGNRDNIIQYLQTSTLSSIDQSLKFSILYIRKTGELVGKISGSFAKYWSKGISNELQLNIHKLKLVLNELESKYQVSISHSKFNTLETRVLLKLSTENIDTFLKSLISFRDKEFEYSTMDNGLQYYELKSGDWMFKLYPKTTSLLTIEIKHLRGNHLQNIGISNVGDILNSNVRLKALEFIIAKLKLIRLSDNRMDFSRMSRNEQLSFEKMRNPKFWLDNSNPDSFYGIMNKEKRRLANTKFDTLLGKYEISHLFPKVFNDLETILEAEKGRSIMIIPTKYTKDEQSIQCIRHCLPKPVFI